MTPPWFLPLRDYVGTSPVIEDFPDDHPSFVAAQAQLRELSTRVETLKEIPLPQYPGVEARVTRSSCVLLDRRSRQILGGKTTTLIYIEKDHRGRGLGAELHILIDLHLRADLIFLYTRQGIAARIGAHRRHVERALLAGQGVPDEVLADYCEKEGRLVLRQDFPIKIRSYA